MPRKTPSASHENNIIVPADAYLELQAFHDELVGIADTIDPATAPSSAIRKPELSRRRALATVFRLWADQMNRNLKTMRPT